MMEEKSDPTKSARPSNVQIIEVEQDGSKPIKFQKHFTVDWTNPETGERLVHTFGVRRARLGDITAYGSMKARLLGEVPVERVDFEVAMIAEAIAYTHQVLFDTPSWWQPNEFHDPDLLYTVYKYVRSYNDSFRVGRVGEQRSAAADGGSKAA